MVYSKDENEIIEFMNLLVKTNDGVSQLEKLNWNIVDFLKRFDKLELNFIQFMNICRKITVSIF